jgi:hypothetical protein
MVFIGKELRFIEPGPWITFAGCAIKASSLPFVYKSIDGHRHFFKRRFATPRHGVRHIKEQGRKREPKTKSP